MCNLLHLIYYLTTVDGICIITDQICSYKTLRDRVTFPSHRANKAKLDLRRRNVQIYRKMLEEIFWLSIY